MDLEKFFQDQNKKKQVKILTCGSVDDGKSTLLGRLLFDSQNIFLDQMDQAKIESEKYGTQGKEIDLALLVDGLQAEREQGITIDVAYRYFETSNCKFIIADTPGHEQYTRNMATGASNSDLAIILIDAQKGVLEQTRRHSFIVNLLGIKHIVVAINKMDLVNYNENIFETIVDEYKELIKNFTFTSIKFIPLSALKGDNVFSKFENINWYKGSTLIETLEKVDVSNSSQNNEFSFPVQWVNRSSANFRGYSGTITDGKISKGDLITTIPSNIQTSVKNIYGTNGELSEAYSGQAITLTLSDELDISRGDIILSKNNDQIIKADQFASHLIWMDQEPMLPERNYIFRFNNSYINGKITDLVHCINVNSYEEVATKKLNLNDIAYCKVAIDRVHGISSYSNNQKLGSFVIIDPYNNRTIGVGMIDHTLRRSSNISWQEMSINKKTRSELNSQKPCVVWFTGLSGSGKSTIANILEQKLHTIGKRTYLLDGDNVRHGLNKDLGFTDTDRVENIRRVAEVSKLMVDAGLITLVSFISPFKSERQMARNLLSSEEFFEIFVNTSLEECEKRDPKGLYKKARAGELKNFTGIDSSYEEPENPDLILNTSSGNAEQLTDQIIKFLKDKNKI
ncbi:adenylyl-sulfate kinase [Alphaproteobacteria bacterium]|nr:adenylyl-sulfate kinase [Alphaproteobacteria bacterium]